MLGLFSFLEDMNMDKQLVEILALPLILYTIWVYYMGLKSLADPEIVKTIAKIYEESDLNLVGCIALFLFYLVLNPIGYLIRFLYWIFHVGRSN